MKRTIALLLICTLLFTSCSAKGIQSSKEQNAKDKISEESKEEKEKTEKLSISIIQQNKTEGSDPSSSIYTTNSVVKVGRYQEGSFVEQKGYDNLKESIQKLNDEIENNASSFKENVPEEYLQYSSAYFKDIVNLFYIGNKTVSFSGFLYTMKPGMAHGQTSPKSYNYDIKSGKLLSLQEVLTNPEEFPKIFKDEFYKKYPGKDTNQDLEEYASKFEYDWNIDDEKIQIKVSPYSLSTFADGILSFDINFSDYPELVKREYKNRPAKKYIKDANTEGDMEIKMPDKSTKLLQYTQDEDYEAELIRSYTINYTGRSISNEEGGYKNNRYLIRDDKNMYYAVSTLDFGGGYTNLYKLSDDTITEIYSSQGYPSIFEDVGAGNTDPDNIILYDICYILGAYYVSGYYHIDDKTGFEPNGKYFYYDENHTDIDNNLTLKQDIEVPMVDMEGNEIEKKTLESGSSFTIFRTDKKSLIDLKGSDGNLYRFLVEVEGNHSTAVEGKNQDDLFEGITYAG